MIRIENLHKQYKNFSVDLSLEIPEGSAIGLVGKNGHGKSTTIKAILGLIRPDSGKVTINGHNPYNLSSKEKAEMGVVLSDSGFCKEFCANDVYKILKATYKRFKKDWFIRECEKNNIDMNKPIKQYSTGMKTKLKLIAAMSHPTKILILDEPTAGLDVEARNEICQMIRNYLDEDEKRTLLITSHIASDIETLCDHIYLIHNGKIIFNEETQYLLSNYGTFKVTADVFPKLEQNFIIAYKQEEYGYCCFTNNRQFYQIRYPDLVVENSSIDDAIVFLSKEVAHERTAN